MNQLGNNDLWKLDFSSVQAVNNLKGRKMFSDQMNRNRLDLTLTWRDLALTLTKHEDIILNSMFQTREKWGSLF